MVFNVDFGTKYSPMIFFEKYRNFGQNQAQSSPEFWVLSGSGDNYWRNLFMEKFQI